MTRDTLLDIAPFAVWLQREEDILAANQQAATFFGVSSPDELEGVSVLEFVSESEYERMRRLYRQVPSGEEFTETLDTRIVDRTGATKWGRFVASPFTFEEESAIFVIAQDVTEEIRQQGKLEDLTTRFESALEGSETGVWVWDLETNRGMWDERTERLFGYEPGEFPGTVEGYLDRIHPDDMDRFEAANEQALAEGNFQVEVRVVVDGEVQRWVGARGDVHYEDGEPDRMVGIVADITDRKEREERLERYRQVVENSTDMLAVVDRDYRYLVANRQYREFHDLSANDDLQSLVVADVLSKGEFEEAKPHMDRAFEGEPVSYEMTRVDSDGNRRTLDVDYYPLGDGESPTSVVASMRDVTERKEREAQLQRERDRFSALFRHFPEPTVAASLDGERAILQRVNPAFEEVFGYDAEKVVGEPINDHIVPEEARDEATRIDERIEEGDLVDEEVRRLTADGPGDFLFRNIPIPAEGREDHYGVYVDITERKERERELRRQNERLDEFAAVVSHDLRNPLNVARGRASLAVEQDDVDHVEGVLEALDRMGEIIEDTLTLAKEGDTVGGTERIALFDLLKQCWSMVETREAQLEVDDNFTIQASRDRLHHVFENLFRNAVEHGSTSNRPEGDDAVEHGTQSPGESALTIRVGLAGDESFYVEDDGSGIPDEEKGAVFEPGHTSAEEGTGLGLTIVHRIAEAHGWAVSVTDSESGGARFIFEGVDIE